MGLLLAFSIPVFAGTITQPYNSTKAVSDRDYQGNYKSKLKDPVATFDFIGSPPIQSINSQYLIGSKKPMISYPTFDKKNKVLPWVFLRIGTGD